MADPYESYIQALLNNQQAQSSQISNAYGNVQGAPIAPKPNLGGQLAPVQHLATASPYAVEQQAAGNAFGAIQSGGGGVLSALQGLAGAQNHALQTQAQLEGQDLLTSLYNSTNESLMRAALEQQQWQAQQEQQQQGQNASVLQQAIEMASNGVPPSAIEAYVNAVSPGSAGYLDQLFPNGTNPFAEGQGPLQFAPEDIQGVQSQVANMIAQGMNNAQIRSILAAQFPQYAGNPDFENLINSAIEQQNPGTFARFGGVEPPGAAPAGQPLPGNGGPSDMGRGGSTWNAAAPTAYQGGQNVPMNPWLNLNGYQR